MSDARYKAQKYSQYTLIMDNNIDSSADNRYWHARFVTIVGAIVNALLGIFKVLGGIFFNSSALLADGIHSFSDLITDAMVIIASKYGSQDADSSHPYGHQRIETVGALLLSLLLILAGFGIGFDAFNHLVKNSHENPEIYALPIVLLSIFANEWLFHYTKRTGKKINSDILITNAWHHRSDALSSIIVLIGLFGSYLGFAYFDSIAAVIVGFLIIKMGIDYAWSSVRELIDTAVAPESLAEIEKIIKNTPGVLKVHQLRTRSMGGDIFIDVHIQVKPYISVSEGHYIAQQVHFNLIEQIEKVKDVTVHVDPEDDEVASPSWDLPSRDELEEKFLQNWFKQFDYLHDVVIHYLDGKISIDLHCKDNLNGKELIDRVTEDLKNHEKIVEIKILKIQEDL